MQWRGTKTNLWAKNPLVYPACLPRQEPAVHPGYLSFMACWRERLDCAEVDRRKSERAAQRGSFTLENNLGFWRPLPILLKILNSLLQNEKLLRKLAPVAICSQVKGFRQPLTYTEKYALQSTPLHCGICLYYIFKLFTLSGLGVSRILVSNVCEPLRQMSNRMQAKKQWDKRNQRGREEEGTGLL